MPTWTRLLQQTFGVIATGALSLGGVGTAGAVTYDFDKILAGGGGGPNVDPKRQQYIRRAGTHMCVDVRGSSTPPANRVMFTIWHNSPHPKSRIAGIAIDTGRHTNLFSNVTVLVHTPSVKPKITPRKGHAFLPGLSFEYWIDLADPGGLAPGNTIVLAATLGSGKTLADVVSALNEGVNPATAATGLRIGVMAIYLLGGPPPGVATISDDGGWVVNGVSARCGAR